MRLLVREGRAHPRVQARARQIVEAAPNLHPVAACFRFVQALPYRRDESIADEAGLADTSEILQGAPWQLEVEAREGAHAVEGDCDCRCVLLQSLLESLGYPTAFVLVRGPGRPDYSHVYTQVTLPNGGKVPLDTIMDGNGGRPFFGPGDEVKPPKARGRKVIPVARKGALRIVAACCLFFLGVLR